MRIYLNERAPHPGSRLPICYGTGDQADETCQGCHYLSECRPGGTMPSGPQAKTPSPGAECGTRPYCPAGGERR